MRSTWKTGAVAAIVALLALPALSALPTAASASPPGSGFGFGHHPLRIAAKFGEVWLGKHCHSQRP